MDARARNTLSRRWQPGSSHPPGRLTAHVPPTIPDGPSVREPESVELWQTLPLVLAAVYGQTDVARELLARGARVNARACVDFEVEG